MFRCNGWCFPWTIAALGGTNICLRQVTGKSILENIFQHSVTHFCGPPIILNKIAETDHPPTTPYNVDVLVAGTMPTNPQIRTKLESLGFNISYGYGMSEALGPVTSLPWRSEIPDDNLEIRQGIRNLIIDGIDVKDPVTMASVPSDGKTIGEIMLKSNTIMLGYLKKSKSTEEVFKGGWYRTKDLGIKNQNGNIQLKDRAVDVIITGGGEIVSSLEVESVIANHPAVMEVAVVGKSDDVFGEIPCAFVKIKEGFRADSEEIISFCEKSLPVYMIPKAVIFGELPVNSTGKIQKFVLRERLKGMMMVG